MRDGPPAGAAVRRRLDWTPAASLPPRAAVLRSQGLPDGAGLPPRIARLLDGAFDAYLALAAPRGLVDPIGRAEFASVYRGDGRNVEPSPLVAIFPRADALALFVCTVGPAVSGAIADLFARNEPARAWMLDAVASEAADGLADAAGRDLLARLRAAGAVGADARVLPYSPGYCGWHVSGQRALFTALDPAEIDVTLGATCLMQPLKSVSGVLVAATAGLHEFSPEFPCCAECGARPCQDRMASLHDD